MGCLCSVSDTNDCIRAMVSGLVVRLGISSTSCITGAGLKKWTPITWAARADTAPSFTIGMDEVFEARTASSSSRIAPILLKSSSLMSSRSLAASTTSCRSASSSKDVENLMDAKMPEASSSVSLPARQLG